jgi:putative tricarboxylic transport membrane protein
MNNLIQGLDALLTLSSLAYLFGGAVLGVVVGVIPGLSTVLILSVLLVFTDHISLTATLCLFLGAQCGSFYSASITSILLNTPAHPEAFPITFDGYPMARKGQPARALGLSAGSTAVGGIIGCIILVGFLQVINYLPGVFHPPEFVALVTLAMIMIGTLGSDSVGKALAAAGIGFVLASVGPSAISGTYRFTFNSINLYTGISLVALALGLFAIPQMIMIFGTGTTTARQDMAGQEMAAQKSIELPTTGYYRQFLGGVGETFKHWGVLLQSGVVGGLTGIVPGIGGFTGNFLAYGIAKQTASKKTRDLYGTGIPQGIIAPEGSSLAKEAGHIVPIIGLGLPGGVAGALFIAALSIKNIKTGYGFDAAYPGVTGQIVWVIALSGIIGTVVGALIGPFLARITKVPGPLVVPFIFALCLSGPFLTDTQFFSVIEMLVFGVVGLALRRLRYPLGSFVMGLVLGPTFEQNIYLTNNIYPGFSFIWQRPIADVIFLIAIVVIVAKTIEIRRAARIRKQALADAAAGMTPEQATAERRRVTPYPLLAPIVSILLLALSLYVVIFSATNFDLATGAMPIIGGVLVGLPMLFFLPRDIVRYIEYRRDKAAGVIGDLVVTSGELPVGVTAPGMAPQTRRIPLVATLDSMNEVRALARSPIQKAGISIERSWKRDGQYRWEVVGLAWLVGAFVLCWLIGFVPGTAIFMLAYGLFGTNRSITKTRTRILFALISTVVMTFATYEMLSLTHLIYTPVVHF